MLTFNTTVLKFKEQGEKTGWTYIEIPLEITEKLNPGVKKAYRVKGTINKIKINMIALTPMGNGHFIMALKADLRKAIGITTGSKVCVGLALDKSVIEINAALMACLADEPIALANFNKLAPSHKKYYSNWIEQAKTEATQTKRIAQTVTAMLQNMNYGELIRSLKVNGD
jgi:hypothetical protein